MTEYLTEQEQVELLKKWIKQYSLVILAGVILAIVAISAWRYWQERQANLLSHASAVYDEMLTRRVQNDSQNTLIQANKLITHYPSTVYAQMAALILARNAVDHHDYAVAEKQFRWVLKKTSIKALREIARLRLARVLIDENQPTESISLLKKVDDDHFMGLIDEVKGDAYLALNDAQMARQAYGDALAALPNADAMRPLLRMKYDNLSTVTNTMSASSS